MSLSWFRSACRLLMVLFLLAISAYSSWFSRIISSFSYISSNDPSGLPKCSVICVSLLICESANWLLISYNSSNYCNSSFCACKSRLRTCSWARLAESSSNSFRQHSSLPFTSPNRSYSWSILICSESIVSESSDLIGGSWPFESRRIVAADV